MTPFDQAWDLIVKMPVVPESIVWDENRVDGKYIDRKTGEEMPIFAQFSPQWTQVRGGIGSEDSPYSSMKAWSPSSMAWNAENAFTEPNYRRRGYSKELYDFIAHLLEGTGGYLLPDEEQSHEMSEMWKKHAPNGLWPSNRIGGSE